jgi:PAS domain-containing protein
MNKNKPSYQELELQIIELKKEREETFVVSEKRYSDLFNSMSENFMLVELIRDNTDKVIDLYYLQVNPSFEKLVNLSKDKLIGKRAKEVFKNIDEYWLEVFDKVDKSRL